jgi:RNA polymerase sigma-70 factor, ECF subfamily
MMSLMEATTAGTSIELDQWDRRQCLKTQAGDNAACEALFKRHEPRIARAMWRFSRDRGVHAELVQEVFVQAYLSLPRYRPGKVPFEHWLVRIATRVGYQFWKKQARQRKMEPLSEGLSTPASPEPIDPSAAAAALHDLLAQLGPADRLVLTLMYFDECSIKQIAERTGWNSAMVKMRAYRARNRLKEMIERKNLTEVFTGLSHEPT